MVRDSCLCLFHLIEDYLAPATANILLRCATYEMYTAAYHLDVVL